MWPTLFTIGEGPQAMSVHTWGTLITIAFLAAAGVVQLRSARAGVDGDRLVGMYVVAFVVGLGGARLLHYTMAEAQRFWSDPLVLLRFWEGGFAFYGGVILASAACILYLWWRGMPVWRTTDLVAPALMLGLGIGRIGCFFAGCCHGQPVDLPPGATNVLPESFPGGALYLFGSFPFLVVENDHGVGTNHTPLLPTQLWSAVIAFSLFGLLSWRWHRRRYHGQVFGWFLVVYPVMRAVLEEFRGDVIRGVDWFGVFSTSQLVGIPVFLLGWGVVLVQRRRAPVGEGGPSRRPADPAMEGMDGEPES